MSSRLRAGMTGKNGFYTQLFVHRMAGNFALAIGFRLWHFTAAWFKTLGAAGMEYGAL